MSENKTDPEVFEVKRQIKGSNTRGLIGFIFFVLGIISIVLLVTIATKTGAGSGIIAFFSSLIIIFFIIGSVLQIKSSENGELMFQQDIMIYKNAKQSIEIHPKDIKVAQRKGELIKIVAAGRTIVFTSDKSEAIADKIRCFLDTETDDDNVELDAVDSKTLVNTDEKTPAQKADSLREYKKLVDDGVITQEQFDEFVKKTL